MEVFHYKQLKRRIRKSELGHDYTLLINALNDPCNCPNRFAFEYVWVVINAGMKYQIASKICYKVIEGLQNNIPVRYIFNHKQKVEAIEKVYANRITIFEEYQCSNSKIYYLETLPWIGSVTKYHLARNLGINVCKPDRHLVRIAKKFNSTPSEFCGEISKKTGDRIGIVDFVIWGSGNLGLL